MTDNKQTKALDFPRVSDNNALQLFIEEVKKVMIPLVPELYVFTKPELKIGFQKVSVNLEKDTYIVDGGKYSLHLNKLSEIAQAAGLIITDSRELLREKDESGRATLIKHQVSWEMKSIDGSVKSGVATGEYNYLEDCARFVYKADEVKSGKTIAKKGELKTAQINKRRTYGGSLAESNAMSRAISKALVKLQQSFTKEELSKPFLVPCVITDFSDILKQHPDLERLYIAQQLGIVQNNPIQLEQKPQSVVTEVAQVPQPKVEPESKPESKPGIEEAKVIEEKKDGIEIKGNFAPNTTNEEKAHIVAESFRDCKQNERTEKIEALIKSKNYKRANPQTKINAYSVDKQIELIEKLLLLEDAKN
jgi:hypothetical protein